MNIYVGKLSYEVTEADLRLAFEPFGQVESVTIIKNKHSGQSKGFGSDRLSSLISLFSSSLMCIRLFVRLI